ncbi:AraC family transcriptional regulator [Chitinophaga horti]|uniref:AraC family transcriptional regulator n=1 Tax=Chitinophaga horti TaxID=2920382 RepID=A0ABY6IWL6_9BACT|nr:AraC family transcriptional regulator [Chitinophaga horti]UYQ91775.1 AraC family transcriptional regulator [Chitinophaga horti]
MYLNPDYLNALQQVKQHIDLTIPERIDVDDLTKVSNLNKTKLIRGFRTVYNTTIYRYWLEQSMAIAKAMIEEGAQIKAVSSRLKYSTTGSFRRAFKDVYKINPTEVKTQ